VGKAKLEEKIILLIACFGVQLTINNEYYEIFGKCGLFEKIRPWNDIAMISHLKITILKKM